jgi:hypothetical protein
MEMKFRAKYHGEEALKLGLSPEQLLLLEQFTEELKHGTSEEGRLVDQLTKRVRLHRQGTGLPASVGCWTTQCHNADM